MRRRGGLRARHLQAASDEQTELAGKRRALRQMLGLRKAEGRAAFGWLSPPAHPGRPAR
jgi:hypothetical protein